MERRHYQTLYESEKYHWWYRVRRKIVLELIDKYTGNKNSMKLLDVGCGTGELLSELSSRAEVFGIDASQQAIDFCKERGLKNVSVTLGAQIPFPDDHFDIVLCLDVLEHIEDDESVIKELRRVSKPGAIIITFVPTFKFLWGKTDEISHHFRRYRLPELIKKLNKNGLRVVRSSYFNFLLFFPILFSRWLVNGLKLPIQSENETGNGLVNKLLFWIFSLEIPLLRVTNFPFGVSGLIISKKPSE